MTTMTSDDALELDDVSLSSHSALLDQFASGVQELQDLLGYCGGRFVLPVAERGLVVLWT